MTQSLRTYSVIVHRSATKSEPVIVLANGEANARKYAKDAVRLRHGLLPSVHLFTTNVRRVK